MLALRNGINRPDSSSGQVTRRAMADVGDRDVR